MFTYPLNALFVEVFAIRHLLPPELLDTSVIEGKGGIQSSSYELVIHFFQESVCTRFACCTDPFDGRPAQSTLATEDDSFRSTCIQPAGIGLVELGQEFRLHGLSPIGYEQGCGELRHDPLHGCSAVSFD